jgi:hypothetical protein
MRRPALSRINVTGGLEANAMGAENRLAAAERMISINADGLAPLDQNPEEDND